MGHIINIIFATSTSHSTKLNCNQNNTPVDFTPKSHSTELNNGCKKCPTKSVCYLDILRIGGRLYWRHCGEHLAFAAVH